MEIVYHITINYSDILIYKFENNINMKGTLHDIP